MNQLTRYYSMTHLPELRTENMKLKNGNYDVERKIKNLEKSNSELTLENLKLNPEIAKIKVISICRVPNHNFREVKTS